YFLPFFWLKESIPQSRAGGFICNRAKSLQCISIDTRTPDDIVTGMQANDERRLAGLGRAFPYGDLLSLKERRSLGQSLRARVRRVDQSLWRAPADRPDLLSFVLATNQDRQQALLPFKWSRMDVSPFSFFRGAAGLMALDLCRQPNTGLKVQLCGDAHVQNLGA